MRKRRFKKQEICARIDIGVLTGTNMPTSFKYEHRAEATAQSRRRVLWGMASTGVVIAGCRANARAELDDTLRPATAAIQEAIEAAVQSGEVASVAMALAVDGRLIWSHAAGWADRARRIRADVQTIYPVASVAKPFTAMGVMRLVDRGDVSLDAPVNAYLGDARLTARGGDIGQASVRQVLQHRSGMPAHGQYFYAGSSETPPEIEDVIRRYGVVAEQPGRYVYSNLGYGVLAYLTQRVSRTPYPIFMRDTVLAPLGLTRTSIEIESEPAVEAAASHGPDGAPLPYYRFDEWGSGRVFSTVEDLARFGLFHLGYGSGVAPLSRSTVATMVEDRVSTGSQTGRYGLDWFYGLGWGGRTRSAFGPMWYGHDGGMPGVAAELRLLPERGAVIVAVANSRTDLTRRIVDDLTAVLTPQYADGRARDPSSMPAPAQPSQAPVGRWVGVIGTAEGDVPMTLRIDRHGDGRLQIGPAPEAAMSDLQVRDGHLRGQATGSVVTSDLRDYPHHVELNLAIERDRLRGVVANAAEPPLYHFFLAHAATLARA